jgi:enamine deaminase RidA (YjgF/YER057c/UK114 family)
MATSLFRFGRSVGPRAARLSLRTVATEAQMKEKGIVLPEYQDAVWNYVKAQRTGNLMYIGDHVGQTADAVTVRGKVGSSGNAEVSVEQAIELAGNSAKRLLSTISFHLDGDLDRVEKIVMLNGFVNGEPEFREHGKVINGASDMMVAVLGDRGRHARTCTGSGSLPAAVTVDCIVQVRD